MYKLLLAATLTLSGLIAGLLYAYSVSVNPGLKKLTDPEYLVSMQHINRAILNPLFFISFAGTALLLLASAWMQYSKPVEISFGLMLAAVAIYLAGVIGVTMLGNVPLNEALDKFNISASSPEQIKYQWDLFENPWNNFHSIRTWASVISFVLAILSCLNLKQK